MNLKKLMIALILVVSVLGTVGCEEKGEAEKAELDNVEQLSGQIILGS